MIINTIKYSLCLLCVSKLEVSRPSVVSQTLQGCFYGLAGPTEEPGPGLLAGLTGPT